MIEPPDEVSCLEYSMFTSLLDEPVLLSAFTGDCKGGAGVGPPDPRQRGDRLVHALLVLQPAHVEQFRRSGARPATGERPARRLDAVADPRGLGQAGAEQIVDLVAHR